MKILVIGGGGREHALVWKIRQSALIRSGADLLCVPGNAGIEELATCIASPSGGLSDVATLADLAAGSGVDLVVVGPELPLTLGLADELLRRGVPVFGATRAASRLEGSKVFAKEFMRRHSIPTAPFEVFTSLKESVAYLESADVSFPIVVKADGLAAGKGVVVAADRAEAVAAASAMLLERRFGAAGERILIEKCLTGVEVSFFAMTDGDTAAPLTTCQDYKRLADADKGPNTGGMGAYSPSVEIDDALEKRIMRTIVEPTVRGMAAEGSSYRGVLYVGLMLTAEGPMVLEFNARFGDPETQVLMPRIESDIVPLMMAAAGAGAPLTVAMNDLRFRPGGAVCVVAASRGYPDNAETGQVVRGLETVKKIPDTVVFHAATGRGADSTGRPAVLTTGGRVLAVSSTGRNLDDAIRRAYQGVESLSFDGMQFRKDIGRDVVQRRVQ